MKLKKFKSIINGECSADKPWFQLENKGKFNTPIVLALYLQLLLLPTWINAPHGPRSKVVTVWQSMRPYYNNFTDLAECFKWKCIWYKLQVFINMMQGPSCCWLGAGLLYLLLSPEIMPQWVNHKYEWLPFGSDISSLCIYMCIYVCLVHLLLYPFCYQFSISGCNFIYIDFQISNCRSSCLWIYIGFKCVMNVCVCKSVVWKARGVHVWNFAHFQNF